MLDTNVIIDNLARRDEFAESLHILNFCEDGLIEGFVSTITIMDVMYVLRKHLNIAEIRDAMWRLIQIVDVVPALKSDINTAFASDFSDFEDAVQASCAARLKLDYIVTRNQKDFQKSSVPAILPKEILKLLQDI